MMKHDLTEAARQYISNIRHGFRNLCYWLPVIWLDRDWDYVFLFCILRHKLSRMEQEIRAFPAIDSERQASHIHEAILLLNRLIAQDYEKNAFLHHRQKWGGIRMSVYPAENGNDIIQLSYTNAQTPDQLEQAHREAMRLYKHAEYMEQQDIHRLFDILRRHMLDWWI